MKIHYKITLVFSLLILVILSSTYVYLKKSMSQFVLSDVRARLTSELELSRSLLLTEPLDKLVPELSRNLGVRVTVISMDGNVLADSDLTPQQLAVLENHKDRPEVRAAVAGGIGESIRYSTTIKHDMLYLAAVYGYGVGIVRLSEPLSSIQKVFAHLDRLLLVTFLLAFAAVFVSSSLLAAYISLPLKNITGIAQSIAAGDFGPRAHYTQRDEIGELACAINHMSTQLKQKIEEVNQNRSYLEAVFLSMFDGVMILDARGKILLMNRSLGELLDIADAPGGKQLLEVIRNADVKEIADQVLRMQTGVAVKDIAILHPREKSLLVHATPVAVGGLTAGAILVFHDITRLKQLENVRRDFVANVSHELRTPVTNIKGYAETLFDGALEDKQRAREFVGIILTDANRLVTLIDDLLDLARIESGKEEFKIADCSLKDIAAEVIANLQKKAILQNITIQNNLGELQMARADRGKLAQVIFNLVDNAIKYNQPGGSVTISALCRAKDVLVEVADTGIGVPEQDLPRIFERFYRVDKGRSKAMGGTGLGLSIVKNIVQAHGGEVSVRSVPGQGSVFSFSVPRI